MKRLSVLAALAGLILLSVLVAFSGAGDVLEAVSSAGWATVLVVLARVVAMVAAGYAWQLLFPPAERLALRAAILIRSIREGINQLLPVAQIGGDLIGARLATAWRCEGALAWASVVADIAVQAGTQFVFAALGLGLLVFLVGDGELVRYLGAGMIVGGIGIAAFVFLQRREGSRLFLALGRKFAGGREWAGMAAVERFYERLRDIYAHPRGVAGSALIHAATWLFGSVEVWVALHFMGHPVSFAEAVVIESLGQAVRGAAFAVPGGLGVQEGGYIALCALFGVPAGPALALSLVKRVADLALGLPALLAWQWIEGRRLFKRQSGPASSRPDAGPLPEAR